MAVLVLEMPGDDDGDAECSWSACQPHPELVKAQRPTAVQVTQVAALLGFFAGGSYLAGELRVGERP